MRELRYIAYMAELDFGTAAAITHTRLRRGNVYVQRRWTAGAVETWRHAVQAG